MNTVRLPLYDKGELKALSDRFEGSSPEQILEWAAAEFGERLTMATAFGPEGCVLIAMLSGIAPNTHVFNLETGYQFPETLAMRDRLRDAYGIDVQWVQAEESVEAMEARFGGPINQTDPDECCRIRKVVPLAAAVKGFDAWISAIRRDQTAERATAGIVEWTAKHGLVKVNPLANWTKKDVWNYIIANNVPYNPLHDQGFASIGCAPCTRAVAAGEDDRAGRWANSAKTECGVNYDNGAAARRG